MPRKPTGDDVLEAEIERAMRPYRRLLPPEMQEVFEDLLVMAYTEHPAGQAILGRLRPRAEPGGSGPRAVFNDPEASNEPASEGTSSTTSGRGGERRGARGSRGTPGGSGGRT